MLGMSFFDERLSPVMGDFYDVLNQFKMAYFSYVCPSSVMTGFSMGMFIIGHKYSSVSA